MEPDLDLLDIRKKLGPVNFGVPREFVMKHLWVFPGKNDFKGSSVLVSCAPQMTPGFGEMDWIHASISHEDRMPSYEDMAMLYKAVFKGGWAFQVFAPVAHHVNIHGNALHLWGRTDGKNQLPTFSESGSI